MTLTPNYDDITPMDIISRQAQRFRQEAEQSRKWATEAAELAKHQDGVRTSNIIQANASEIAAQVLEELVAQKGAFAQRPHPLDELLVKVRAFHVAFGHPTAEQPLRMGPYYVERRIGFIQEELEELRIANTRVAQADAFLDILYFALGGLVEMGLKAGPLFDAVHDANMAKLWPDGELHRDEKTGKTIKPPGWVGPEEAMNVEIARQVEDYYRGKRTPEKGPLELAPPDQGGDPKVLSFPPRGQDNPKHD